MHMMTEGRFPVAAHAARLHEPLRDAFALYAHAADYDHVMQFVAREAAHPLPRSRPSRWRAKAGR